MNPQALNLVEQSMRTARTATHTADAALERLDGMRARCEELEAVARYQEQLLHGIRRAAQRGDERVVQLLADAAAPAAPDVAEGGRHATTLDR